MQVQNTEVSVIGIWLLLVGVIMCDQAVWAVECAMRPHFGPLCMRKTNTMSNSANIVLSL